jgi:hypothetical protein
MSTHSHIAHRPRRRRFYIEIFSVAFRHRCFPYCDWSRSPSSTACWYFLVCARFLFPRPSSVASLGGAVEAGGAEGSSGNRRNIVGVGAARRRASGVLIARVIDVPPWDSLTTPGGVFETITPSLTSSLGVTIVLSRLARASRAFSSF